ncbi:hypothetical protein [Roseateles sp. L2-2]|uniref:hypothetical protein n=1 Tax=Roseateles TaxID=93681 RepID=UPI003D35CEE1
MLPYVSAYAHRLTEQQAADGADPQLAIYNAAEVIAIDLFRRPMPVPLKECSAYFDACEQFVRDHFDSMGRTRLQSHLPSRLDHLWKQLRGPLDESSAQAIAEEARSIVATVLMHLHPLLEAFKLADPPPGNIPALLAGLYRLGGCTLEVNPMDPDARELITANYVKEISLVRQSRPEPDRELGPPADALIDAARQGQPLNPVLRSMVHGPLMDDLGTFESIQKIGR